MAKVISIANLKGGCHKSTTVLQVSTQLESMGKTVLIIDLCQNSGIATGLGYDRTRFKFTALDWFTGRCEFKEVVQRFRNTNIYFIPSSERIDDLVLWSREKMKTGRELIIKRKIEPLKAVFDYILQDNHPSEADDKLIYSLCSCDHALIPMLIDQASKLSAERTVEIVKDLQKSEFVLNYSIIPSGVDFTKGFAVELHKIKEEFAGKGIGNFTHPIRFSTMLSKSSLNGKLLQEYKSRYAENLLNDYRIITQEVLNRVD